MSLAKIAKIVLVCVLALFLVVGFEAGVIFPPRPDSDAPIVIERGMNAEQIAGVLKERNIIRSKLFFVWAAYFGGVHNRLAAGSFTFEEPLSLFGVLDRLLQAQPEITILVTEGMNIKDIQTVLMSEKMQAASRFVEVARNSAGLIPSVPRDISLEGFLFPDTYRFYKSAAAEEVVDTMLDNFFKKIEPLKGDIENKKKTLFEIIIMASIIEKEAKHKIDLAIISGILWKRISINMPLQTDATLFYERGKTSSELTVDDLKSASPYNTYINKGLPLGPIGNPGIDAIRAAIHPEDSDYIYYLSDGDGIMHYAKTFEEHKRNKARYIK
jgi:UPF0755 protein